MRHIEQIFSALSFRKDAIEQSATARAKHRRLKERIFSQKPVHKLLALIQAHRRVPNDLALFTGSLDNLIVLRIGGTNKKWRDKSTEENQFKKSLHRWGGDVEH